MIGYAELVDLVMRDRRGGSSSRRYRQYMTAVFCADAGEEAVARERVGSVPIITGAPFYRAEDYHQKYHLRHDSTLLRELAGYTPRQLADSTVAARLNGYAAGHGTAARLREEAPLLALSPVATAHLERLVR